MAVFCPLCDQISFASLDALRCSLIKVANEPLPCPVCHKLYLGLDKLTIHLFSHANINHIRTIGTIMPDKQTDLNINSNKESDRSLKEAPGIPLQQNSPGATEIEPIPEVIHLPNHMHSKSFNAEDLCSSKGYLEDTETAAVSCSNNDLGPPHLKGNFKCHLCSKAFAMKGSLRIHLKVGHCISLPDGFTLKQSQLTEPLSNDNEAELIYGNTNNNYKKLLNNLEFRKLSGNNDDAKEESNVQVMPFKHQAQQQDLHQRQNEQRPEDINSQQFPTKGLVNIMNGITPQFNSNSSSNVNCLNADHMKLWECDVCTKSFTTKYFLKKHKRLHTGEMPYSCEICGRTFTFQQSYHKHLLYHSDEKPHTCSTCGRSFKELSTLHNHERIHSGEKPFKCDICGKSFRQRVSCLVHKRIHTGVMPYKCDNCQKSFRYKVSQRTHKCVAFLTEACVSTQGDNLEQLTDNFIKSLLEGTNANDVDQTKANTLLNSRILPTIAEVRAQQEVQSNAIDDMIEHSYQKLTTTTNSTTNINTNSSYLQDSIPSNHGNYISHEQTNVENSDGCISPRTAQRLQDIRIYSPHLSHSVDLGAEFDGNLTEYLFQQDDVDDYGLSSLL